MTYMKRGERMARNVLEMIDGAGLRVAFDHSSGSWAIQVLNERPLSKTELAAATDLTLFAIGCPRNFGTLVRLYREREGAQ